MYPHVGPHAVDIHSDMGAPWAPSGGGPPLSGWAALGANEPVVPLGPMSLWMSGVLSMRVYIIYVSMIFHIYIYIYIYIHMYASVSGGKHTPLPPADGMVPHFGVASQLHRQA